MTQRKKRICADAVRVFGERHQVLKAIEELGETCAALSRCLAAPSLHGDDHLRYAAFGEILDSEIMIEQMKLVFGSTLSVAGCMQIKLNSLETRIATAEKGGLEARPDEPGDEDRPMMGIVMEESWFQDDNRREVYDWIDEEALLRIDEWFSSSENRTTPIIKEGMPILTVNSQFRYIKNIGFSPAPESIPFFEVEETIGGRSIQRHCPASRVIDLSETSGALVETEWADTAESVKRRVDAAIRRMEEMEWPQCR